MTENTPVRALRWLLPLLVFACAPAGPTRQQYLAQFVGRPEADLVSALGVPTRAYETNGVKFLAYDESRIDLVQPQPMFGPPWWGGGQFPARVVTWQCETTVAVSQGVVRNFSLRGNAC